MIDVRSIVQKFEAFKIEGGGNRASDQCPVAQALGGLPFVWLHDRLRQFAVQDVLSQTNQAVGGGRRRGETEFQSRAGVVMPDLGGIDSVPAIRNSAGKQEIDCRSLSAFIDGGIVSPSLTIETSLGMREKFKPLDEFFGGG